MKPEYVIIMEVLLGRPLKKGEDVHHIDFNHFNDDPFNLVVLPHSEHIRLHSLGNKNWLGKHHSEETRAKMHLSNAGQHRSEEFKAEMRLVNSGRWLGKHHSVETKAKMSQALLGNKRALGNKNSLGHHHSEETKAKMRLAQQARREKER